MITKAILTGGGRATRLRPITTTINKHLIPIANKPMIFHAIEKVVEIGVKEIYINTNPGETELQRVVGDGSRWKIKITFFEQQGGPQGIAHVVKQAEKFIGDEPFLFYLSDNIILSNLRGLSEQFSRDNLDCILAFARVPDPERFGVPVFSENGALLDIVEKPTQPQNNFAVTGIYFYGSKIFFEAFDKIQKSARGEYEISDIHSIFLKTNKKIGYQEITGWWKDTGKPEDLLFANQLLMDTMSASQFIYSNTILSNAKIIGNVSVGVGSKVGDGVTIIGPAIIGNNCCLDHCEIGPYITVGDGSVIKQAKINRSIIFENCEIKSALPICESIIGKNSRISANAGDASIRYILGDHTIIELK